MNCGKVLFLALFAVVICSAGAFAFSIAAPDATVTVPSGGSKDVQVTFTSSTPATLLLSIGDTKPWISLDRTAVQVSPAEPASVTLTISPFLDTNLGLYKITVMAESSETRETKSRDIFISVVKGEIVDIERIVISGEAKPTSTISITAHLRNYRPTSASEVALRMTVTSPSRQTIVSFAESISNIDPDQRITIRKQLLLPAGAEAGVYTVSARLDYEDKTSVSAQTFTVASKPVIAFEEERSPLLFGFRKTITARNDGNAAAEGVEVTQDISPVEAVFFSGDEPAAKNGDTFTWNLGRVAPGSSRLITYSVDYTPLFAFIIALIIAAWVVFTKLRTVRIKKYIMQKKELEEGEEFTVGIEVRNATGSKLDEVVVKDFVPPVFTVRETEGIQPRKKKTNAGTELVWYMKDLHNREERVASYKIIPIFGVHGQIRLPRASVSFKSGKRRVENHSVHAHIGIATERIQPAPPAEKFGA